MSSRMESPVMPMPERPRPGGFGVLVNVARYHLVDRVQYILVPCGVTLFAFLVNLAIFGIVNQSGNFTGGLSALCAMLLVNGAMSVVRSLPFGLALGVSRRTYYLGTILLIVGLGAAYALAITVLQLIETAVNGWGIDLHFFRIPWILDGPAYATWMTAFVWLVLVFVYGMWHGLVFRRWQLPGLVTFIVLQVTALVAAAAITTWVDGWADLGNFFANLSALGLTGLLALLTAVLAVGGFATMRHATV